MPALIIYLLKVNIALVLFYLAYYTTLRRLTFYAVNRIMLIGSVIFSFLYPFIKFGHITVTRSIVTKPLEVIVFNVSKYSRPSVQATQAYDYWHLVMIAICMGTAFMFVRLLIQCLSLVKLHYRSVAVTISGQKVRVVNDVINPFSFWQNIYIGYNKYSREELSYIISHEQIHIKQWHTLDILLAESCLLVCWFNPAVWLLKKAITENLEFIADGQTIKFGINPTDYQYCLLQASYTGVINYHITNNFNLSTLKKRIIMMNTKKSPSLKLVRYGMILTVAVMLLLKVDLSKAGVIVKQHFNKTFSDLSLYAGRAAMQTGMAITVKDPKAKQGIEVATAKVAGIDTVTTDTSAKVKDDYIFYSDNTLVNVKDMGFDDFNSFLLLVPLNIQETEKMFGVKNKKAGVWITKKNKDTEETKALVAKLEAVTGRKIVLPGTVNGAVDAQKAPPITVIGTDGVIYNNEASGKAPLKIDLAQILKSGMIVVVDGNLQPVEKLDGLNQLGGGEIESVSILKGAAATTMYGVKAESGAVIITTTRHKTK